jgi:methyl-accepting chemotaxis protein
MARMWAWIWERLFLRLQIFVGLIGVLCVVLGVTQWSSDQQKQSLDDLSEATMKKLSLIEKANGLVYAVVMESRGIYIADTPDKLEKFSKGLEKHLVTLNETVATWKSYVGEADAKDFEALQKNTAAFVKLRTELVAEGRTKGAAGARAVGDNDANRAVRTAFNKSLELLAANYQQRLAALKAESETKQVMAKLFDGTILGLIIVMTVGGWLWLARYMTRPFTAISSSLHRINAGETDFTVADQQRVDEVGVIARAIEDFRVGLIDRTEIHQREAQEARAKAERQQRLESAIAGFESAATTRVGVLTATSSELHVAAASLSTGAEETARQAEIVTEASDEMNANIDTLAKAGSQLVGAIGEIAGGMTRASEVSERASNLSAETASKFSELATAVSAIGHVVDLINSIAAQTNLLALNATIEAARAGDAGKGFAVVASEVKQLAGQTTKATADIAENVARVQSVTGESISAVQNIGTTIEEMRRIAMEVSSAVEQQRVATQDIAENVSSAATGTQQVSDNITGVAQAADETGVASMKVLQSAGKLSEEAGGIRQEIEGFLATIRAA